MALTKLHTSPAGTVYPACYWRVAHMAVGKTEAVSHFAAYADAAAAANKAPVDGVLAVAFTPDPSQPLWPQAYAAAKAGPLAGAEDC